MELENYIGTCDMTNYTYCSTWKYLAMCQAVNPKQKQMNSDRNGVYGTHAYCAVLSSFVSYKSIHNRFTIGMPSFICKQNLV